MNKTDKITQSIQQLLAAANTHSRERLLDLDSIAEMLGRALANGYSYQTGGTMAKSYKYPAYSTMAFAVTNGPDYIALRIARNNANASPVTWLLPYAPSSVRESDVRHWAARQTLYTLTQAPWLIFARRECKLFIKSQEAR